MIEHGKIVNSGMGGFLNPPTHPEHRLSVQSKKKNSFSMSLSAAIDCRYLDDATKQEAKDILDNWKKLPLNDITVQDWIHHVLGYFKNCFSPDGVDRNANNCLIWIEKDAKNYGSKWCNFERNYNNHLGVMLIRKYYPEYEINENDFENAYWGKRKDVVV